MKVKRTVKTRLPLVKIFLILLSLSMFCSSSYAKSGKILLKNGQECKGEIKSKGNGKYIIYLKNGYVEFEKSEIKRIIYDRNEVIRPAKRKIDKNRVAVKGKLKRKETTTEFDELIFKHARKNNLDPALVKAVIQAESNFNVRDRSNKGACGLMQLMPQTAKLLGVRDIYCPDENIKAGTKFLKDMYYKFDGDLELALAAYNAGPGNVIKYGSKVPPFKETKNYINNIYRNYGRNYRPNRIYTFTDDKGCMNIYNVK